MNISNYQSESAECFEHSDTLQSRENVTRQHVFRERHFRDSNLRFSTPAATLRREQSREKELTGVSQSQSAKNRESPRDSWRNPYRRPQLLRLPVDGIKGRKPEEKANKGKHRSFEPGPKYYR